MARIQAWPVWRPGRGERHWLPWTFFVAFLLIAVESVLIAIVFKGTLLVLLAPGGVCLMKALELWQAIRRPVMR